MSVSRFHFTHPAHIFALALLLQGIAAPSIWAFRLSPMVVSLAPVGSGSTQKFLIENTGHEKTVIQIEAFHRFIDPDGKETRIPTEEFSVDPQQLALAPGEEKSVRVTWSGNHQPDRELNYRLVVSQLPVDVRNSEPPSPSVTLGPRVLLQYMASVYITPPDSMPRLEVESFRILPDEHGQVVLKNTGLAHLILKGTRFFFLTEKGNKFELKDDASRILQDENILAKTSRRFQIEVPRAVLEAEKAKPGSVKLEVEK